MTKPDDEQREDCSSRPMLSESDRPEPKKKMSLWVLGLFGMGALQIATVLIGATFYYLHNVLPQDMFAQLNDETWRRTNVSNMNFNSQQDFEHAKQALMTLSKDDRDNPVPHFLLAELCNTLGRSNEAIVKYNQVIWMTEKSWHGQIAYRSFVDNAHGALALLHYEKGHQSEALQALKAISDIKEVTKATLLQALQDSLEQPDRADFHMLLGKELRNELKLALAAQEFESAERLSNSPQLRLEAVNFMKTQMPQAIRDLTPMARYYSLAGEIYQNDMADLSQAAAYYEKAIRETPSFEWGYNELAVIYRDMKEYGKATSHANNAIALNPDFYNPYLTLGDIALDQENYQAAIAHFQTAQGIISSRPSENTQPLLANIENQIAYAYESLQNYAEAGQHYYQAMITAMDSTDGDVSSDYTYAQDGWARTQAFHQKK